VGLIDGRVDPAEWSLRERGRLAFPPHTTEGSKKLGLRLACQVRVVDDVRIAHSLALGGKPLSSNRFNVAADNIAYCGESIVEDGGYNC
jgi:hypothetical protein